MERMIYEESISRLCTGIDSRQFKGSVNKVKEPNIILMISNAPIHEIEELIISFNKEDRRKNVKMRITQLAARIVEAVDYLTTEAEKTI